MTRGEIRLYHGGEITADVPDCVDADGGDGPWVTIASTRPIAALAIGRRGVWAAGAGGVLALLWGEGVVRRYGSEHGLAGNAAQALCVDADDRPWVAAADGGLACLVDGVWRLCEEAPTDPIRRLAAAEGEGVWASTADAVYRVERPDGAAVPVSEDPLDVEALLGDGTSVLAGGPQGLFRMSAGQAAVRIAPDALPECTALSRADGEPVYAAALGTAFRLEGDEPVRLPPTDDRILALSAARGVVWALTPSGPSRLRDRRWATFRGPARAIASSLDGRLAWIGGKRGVHEVDATTAATREAFRPSDADDLLAPARCVVGDGDGVLVGACSGLARVGGEHDVAVDEGFGDVRSITVAGGDAWALAWPGGLRRVTTAAWSRTPVGSFALATGADEPHVLAGQRLLRFSGETWAGVGPPLPHAPRCALRLGDATWWVGTSAGVYWLDRDAWRLAGEAGGPRGAEIRGLCEIERGLWVATADGLFARVSGSWQRRVGDPVIALAPSSRAGFAWVATAQGVLRYDIARHRPEAAETPISSGLPSGRVTGLYDDGHRLWVTTAAGVGRRELTTEDT